MGLSQATGEARRRAARFLSTLADPARAPIAEQRVAVVVAHPDDETIGCGAVLARLREPTIVIVTDGAPRDLADARAHGFVSAADYACARHAELTAALAHGLVRVDPIELGVPDQDAAGELPALARRLADVLSRRRIDVALTHAYEGGHPDHDATAFAVHAAATLVARHGRSLAIIEMPLYRADACGVVVQDFAPAPDAPAVTVRLTGPEQARKRRMFAAHATQRGVLGSFAYDVERFRVAPAYDFAAPPPGGRFAYEQVGSALTGEMFLARVAAARRELGREPQPDGSRCASAC